MKSPKIQVNLRNCQRKWRINERSVRYFLQKTWSVLNTSRGLSRVPNYHLNTRSTEVSVVFLSDKQMQCYNKAFRNKDYSTDVLSFPVNEPIENKHYLGDILISLPAVERQARERQHSPAKEFQVLLIHGILHLLGYNHETDSGEMELLETQLHGRLLGARGHLITRAQRSLPITRRRQSP